MQKKGVFSTSESSDGPLHTSNHISQIVLEEICMFSSDSHDLFHILLLNSCCSILQSSEGLSCPVLGPFISKKIV